MDRVAIRTGCLSIRSARGSAPAAGTFRHPDYFAATNGPAVPEFLENGHFRFRSPLPSSVAENDVVAGRLVHPPRKRSGTGKGPVVVLVHGWNGEQGYRYLFPFLARRLARLGVSSAMLELPYHGSRKPAAGSLRNFLSGDLGHMTQATCQAIAEIRALIGWLRSSGYGPVGLWGVSLGAWLGGLVACAEEELEAAVLVTPVAKIDQAIDTLAFCSHIRDSLEGRDISARRLNLTEHRPQLPAGQILLVESRYDLFAPAETVEELWSAWGRPEIWRVNHGHISVLLSLPIMLGTARWLQRRLGGEMSRRAVTARGG